MSGAAPSASHPASHPGPDAASPYALLAALPPEAPPEQTLPLLLENLAAATGVAKVELWRAHEGGFSSYLSWPADRRGYGDAVLGQETGDLSALAGLVGVLAAAPVQDDTLLLGAITLHAPELERPDRPDPATAGWLRDTADCVLRVWRLAEARSALAAQTEYTERLAGELAASHARLATVRDRERRRVAAEIISITTDRLGRLRGRVDELAAEPAPGPRSAERLESVLVDLIEDFRVMVRGIYPIVLKTRGPRAALAEVAAGLPRPVRIGGRVPARVDAELGTSLYHLVAAALQALARADDGRADDPLTVELSHLEGRLAAVVAGRSSVSAWALRAALSVDADRLSALSGTVEITADGQCVRLRATLPDRLEPAARPGPEQLGDLLARVRAIAVRLAARSGTGAPGQAVGAVLDRLDGPVRVGRSLRDGDIAAGPELDELARRLPEISFVPASRPDEVDVVLRPSDGDSGVDVELPGAGVLVRGAGWSDLPGRLRTEVVARADLLRARSALSDLARLLHDLPRAGPDAARLGYELELLRAGARELTELEAVALLRTGGLGLSPDQLATAERLLGAHGTAPHERLGLPATTSAAAIGRAAIEQLGPWRRLAAHAAGRPQRTACDMVVRACESMLSRAAGPAVPAAG